ncbi:UNVERIFIED_CONTAM: hypothetical protein GTU68_003035 [Idotea baltica]|nr:hypothetical protein [Idotea baltica]
MFKLFAKKYAEKLLATDFLQVLKDGGAMAHSRFEYVRSFEGEDKLEPLQWIVFHLRLDESEEFIKSHPLLTSPEKKLRDVMSLSARSVMCQTREVALGYGYSNVFNFVLQKETTLYKRRASKLLSNLTSLFSSCFVTEWNCSLLNSPLSRLPTFEGSIYLFPKDQCLRDFLTREQTYCHVRNLRQTTLRNLIEISGFTPSDAFEKVRCASESEQNEMLFSLCGLNYNNEPAKEKKGTAFVKMTSTKKEQNSNVTKKEIWMDEMHTDLYKEVFWDAHFPLEEKTKMNSKYVHLNSLQRKSEILPHTWLVVRIDGKGFHKFSDKHNFAKPNDDRSLKLMTASAKVVVEQFHSIKLSYGQSDEYSFVIQRYGHREKEGYSLISRIVSLFTGAFVQLWAEHFEDQPLLSMPVFDARLVLYPTTSSLKDYLSWRQADCHINNMYNTCFWKLVQKKGLSRHHAQECLKGTFSKDKLAILKDELGINYEEEGPLYRKGTVILNKMGGDDLWRITISHEDIIGDSFWEENSWLIGEEFKAKKDFDV